MKARERPSTAQLLRYFLYLGSLGFGGPVALVGYMQRDLIERRGWFTKDEYTKSLALSQLAPGPLAAQLAICLGYVHSRVRGATLVAFAFVLPSFVMTVAISWLYVRFGGLSWMQAATCWRGGRLSTSPRCSSPWSPWGSCGGSRCPSRC